MPLARPYPGAVALLRTTRRFRRAADGVTVVEFAFIAPPFLLLLGGLIQFAFIIWAQQSLDFTLQRASRGLLTGRFQGANAGTTNKAKLLENLKQEMCGTGASKAATVFTCADVKLNVGVSSDFASGTYPSAYDAQNKTISASFENYACGGPKQIVIVSAAVTVPLFFGTMIPQLSGMKDGSYLLQSLTVFRAEPYAVNNASCS